MPRKSLIFSHVEGLINASKAGNIKLLKMYFRQFSWKFRHFVNFLRYFLTSKRLKKGCMNGPAGDLFFPVIPKSIFCLFVLFSFMWSKNSRKLDYFFNNVLCRWGTIIQVLVADTSTREKKINEIFWLKLNLTLLRGSVHFDRFALFHFFFSWRLTFCHFII
jgi:hypothetical protein